MRYALTREVSPSIARCELTHVRRTPIDVSRAEQQHAVYCDLLASHGYSLIQLPADSNQPDCVFVEDVAIVGPDFAVMTNPGAALRRSEIEPVVAALATHRDVRRIAGPATIDGGDVLKIGRSIWVGRTGRTNDAAIEALREIVTALGYQLRPTGVRGCLHLKSAVTAAGPATVVLDPAKVSAAAFDALEVIEVHPDEPSAANVLQLADVTVVPAGCPRTRERLEKRGVVTCTVDMSELAKAEGALTCCSILFDAR